jgi:hypothetical protein
MEDSGRGQCTVPAGDGLLGAIHCLTAPDADCEVGASEPCYLRQSNNYIAVAVGVRAPRDPSAVARRLATTERDAVALAG